MMFQNLQLHMGPGFCWGKWPQTISHMIRAGSPEKTLHLLCSWDLELWGESSCASKVQRYHSNWKSRSKIHLLLTLAHRMHVWFIYHNTMDHED